MKNWIKALIIGAGKEILAKEASGEEKEERSEAETREAKEKVEGRTENEEKGKDVGLRKNGEGEKTEIQGRMRKDHWNKKASSGKERLFEVC